MELVQARSERLGPPPMGSSVWAAPKVCAKPRLTSVSAPAPEAPRHHDARELFAAYAPFVAIFLTKLGAPRQEIQDLVQDVFLVAHHRGGFTELEAKPGTWLAAIAFRVWSTARRKVGRYYETSDDTALDMAISGGLSPLQAAVAAEGLEQIRLLLEQLDDTSRTVLFQVCLEGKSCVGVAEELGIPVGTVYSRLHSARKRFARAHSELTGEPSMFLDA